MYSSPTRSGVVDQMSRRRRPGGRSARVGSPDRHRTIGDQFRRELLVGDRDGRLGGTVSVEHPDLRGCAHRDRTSAAELASPPSATTSSVVPASSVHLRAGKQQPQVAGRESRVGDGLSGHRVEEGPREQQRLPGADDDRSSRNSVGNRVPKDPSKWNGDTHRVRVSAVESEGRRRRLHCCGEGGVADQHSLGCSRGTGRVDGVGDPTGGAGRASARSVRPRRSNSETATTGDPAGRRRRDPVARFVAGHDHRPVRSRR